MLEITSKKTSTSSTAMVSKGEISGNLTDTRKWESCTNQFTEYSCFTYEIFRFFFVSLFDGNK